jgi:hypothetical protein
VNTDVLTKVEQPDPAAVFAIAHSLWQAVAKHHDTDPSFNASASYNGIDQLMREAMRVAEMFEVWACQHIEFAEIDGVWPYFLADQFGIASINLTGPGGLASFDAADCLRVALALRLPVRFDGRLPLPVRVVAENPMQASPFRTFKIQTELSTTDGETRLPFTVGDEVEDEECGAILFVLYGIAADGTPEHITDRQTYTEVVELARKLAPGVFFPDAPIIGYPSS